MTAHRANRHGTAKFFLAALIVAAAILWYAITHDTPTTPLANATNNPQPATNEQSAVNASSEAENANTAPANTPEPTATFEDADAGIAFDHPASWKVVKDVSGTGAEEIIGYTIGTKEEGAALSIAPLSLEGIIRESFSVGETTTITINGRTAERAVGASAKDGSRVDLLLFHESGKVYVLDGPAEHVDTLGKTFRFTE